MSEHGEGTLAAGGFAGEPVAPERYAHTQVVHVNLYRDEAQRRSFITNVMLHRPTPGYERIDDEHDEHYGFGKIEHAEEGEHECTDACAILSATEDDAQLVMIGIGLNVRRVPDELPESIALTYPHGADLGITVDGPEDDDDAEK